MHLAMFIATVNWNLVLFHLYFVVKFLSHTSLGIFDFFVQEQHVQHKILQIHLKSMLQLVLMMLILMEHTQ
jgi:hypothetical protein